MEFFYLLAQAAGGVTIETTHTLSSRKPYFPAKTRHGKWKSHDFLKDLSVFRLTSGVGVFSSLLVERWLLEL
jgi:hypothetical protein